MCAGTPHVQFRWPLMCAHMAVTERIMTEHSVESRVTDLEIRLTHQEAAIWELSTGLVRQQRVLDDLLLQLTELRRQLASSVPLGPSTEEGPPPHY